MSGFTDFKFTATVYIPSMCLWPVKALAIFRGCAGSSEPSLLAKLAYFMKLNIKFIKMQNRATINLFLGTCMCVCAYIIPVMHS